MSELLVKKNSHHITKPGKMTIIESMGRMNFYPDAVIISHELEPGKVYNFNVDHAFGDMWITKGEDLTLPPKIYDFDQEFRLQVLNTLRLSQANMNIGVGLVGYKGQGKSVTAKQLAIESGLPIICINGVIPKVADFVGYLQQIKQDYCLFVDEFEKLFPAPTPNDNDNKFHTQNSFLSLLDGTFTPRHKRLTILTCNDDVSDKFLDRTSRIRYYKKYDYMNPEVFHAIVADKLKNKKFAKDLEDNLNIPDCTIDILTSIIDEINVHKKPYSSFKGIFNYHERKISYNKYKMIQDRWEYQEEIELTKIIPHNVDNICHYIPGVNYQAQVKYQDSDKIVYEEMEYEYSEDGETVIGRKKMQYKLTKNKFTTVKASSNLIL